MMLWVGLKAPATVSTVGPHIHSTCFHVAKQLNTAVLPGHVTPLA